jgi:DNA-binding transcriptional MerR regulator
MTDKQLTIQELAQIVNEQLKNTIQNQDNDARQSEVVSERRIRDYITKGLLDKPFGSGPKKWYTQVHVDKLLALRQLQKEGLSDQYLKKLSTTQDLQNNSDSVDIQQYLDSRNNEKQTIFNATSASFSESPTFSTSNNVDKQMRDSALDFLAQISPQNKTEIESSKKTNLGIIVGMTSNGLNSSTRSTGLIKKHYENNPEFSKTIQSIYETKTEKNNSLIPKSFNEYQLGDDSKITLKIEQGVTNVNKEKVLNQIKIILDNLN